jgi:pyruvate formate-lyase activating enzyme-like uncharacterized protein
MKRTVRQLSGERLIVGESPPGCSLCEQGAKMVLFVTGLCESSCYYCPLSEGKMGVDTSYADEMPVREVYDILEEAESIDAEGAGLSGGDPLCNLERLLQHIQLLKGSLGSDFHLHLYTSRTDVGTRVLSELKEAGLDEIRFHPQTSDWSGIEAAIGLGMLVGIEVPAIPGKEDKLKETAIRAESIGVSFMNINELEASETNFERLRDLGMRLTSLDSASIEGSAETARHVIEWAVENLEHLTVHYCSARYKDAVQLRNRLLRRRENTIREFEEAVEDGPLLELGVIRARHGATILHEQLEEIHGLLESEYDVPREMMNIDSQRMRIEIAGWILEELAEELHEKLSHIDGLEMGIVIEYPTWDRFQTLFDPL